MPIGQGSDNASADRLRTEHDADASVDSGRGSADRDGIGVVRIGDSVMKILVVDDSRGDLVMVSSYISLATHHETITARNGVDAIEAFQKEKPDLVLLDVVMPGMDGYEVARRLRSLPGAWAPIIFLSSLDDDEGVASGISAGGDDYLAKPVSRTLLIAKISAMERIADMQARMMDTTQDLARAHKELQAEVARRERDQAEREALHHRLVAASRKAGMAEVATGVLHNVGNLLNSVNVSVTLIADKVREARIANVGKAAELLRDHAGDLAAFLNEDLKGSQLAEYLASLARHLTGEQQSILKELKTITSNMQHITQIITRQQAYAGSSGVTEPASLADLVDDALEMNIGKYHTIEVVRDYTMIPWVVLDRHKVLQILVNLICNAKRALEERHGEDKRLTVRIKRVGGERIGIEVQDNGAGIAAEHLARVFEYGFTTKADGHGFGLHASANTAREMGGSLTCASQGPGTGATFTLELPFEPAEMAA